ncbi:MAG: hypothetical protein ABIS01_10535, partial [Ferruginibacter sp.]
MQINIAFLLVLFCLKLQAQTPKCAKYDEAMAKGYKYFSKKNFDSALIEFQAAQIAIRECGSAINNPKQPADELKKVFFELKKQRDDAVSAKTIAEKAKAQAQTAEKKALVEKAKTVKALQTAEEAERRAKTNLERANKLINAFYF